MHKTEISSQTGMEAIDLGWVFIWVPFSCLKPRHPGCLLPMKIFLGGQWLESFQKPQSEQTPWDWIQYINISYIQQYLLNDRNSNFPSTSFPVWAKSALHFKVDISLKCSEWAHESLWRRGTKTLGWTKGRLRCNYCKYRGKWPVEQKATATNSMV